MNLHSSKFIYPRLVTRLYLSTLGDKMHQEGDIIKIF